jgi:hypothetical protein
MTAVGMRRGRGARTSPSGAFSSGAASPLARSELMPIRFNTRHNSNTMPMHTKRV